MNLFERWNNIIHIWANGMLDATSDTYRNKYSPKSTRLKFGLIFKDLVADFLRIFRSTEFPKSKIWFLALTQNNYETLKEIQTGIPDSTFVSFFRFRSTINEDTLYFNLPLKFFYHFVYPFTLFFYWLKNKKKAAKHYDILLAINGSYEECLRLLNKSKPKAIVFSNDHLVIARALLLAAKKIGIKTYYVQHACVSEYFPPLEFTYALLEGKDALEKYKICGDISSKVYLVGMAKFDKYSEVLNINKKLKTLGIPFNISDDIESVYNLVECIGKENPKLDLIIRAHPEDDRNLSKFNKHTLSNPRSESPFQFLTRTDVIISADSSIHLEAALLNVYPLYFNFNKGKALDYYGFVKNNLVDFCENIEEVKMKIVELQILKPNITHRTEYYNSSNNTDYYGKSTEKIIDIILSTINNTDDEK